MDYGLFITYMDLFSQPPAFLVLCPHFTHDMKKIKSRWLLDFPHGLDSKESSCNVGDLDSLPGLGRSPGRGHGNALQYSCLENPHRQRNLASYSPQGHRVRHNWKTKHNVLRCSLGWVGEGCGLFSSIIWLCNDDFSFQLRFPQRLQRVHSWVSCLNPQSMRIPSWLSSQTWTWLLQNGWRPIAWKVNPQRGKNPRCRQLTEGMNPLGLHEPCLKPHHLFLQPRS